MAEVWPWLVLAGLGALHGLSPTSGWAVAAACGVQAGDEAEARRALGPIAFGHVASIAVLAAALSSGLAVDRALMRDLAGALLLGAALWRLLRGMRLGLLRNSRLPLPSSLRRPGRRGLRPPLRLGGSGRHAGIALASFFMASAQGAGLMLVPALAPLCAWDGSARTGSVAGSLVTALAAVGVHTAAMLLATGLVASGVCRGLARRPHRFSDKAARRAWTSALAATGTALLAMR